MPKIIGNIVGSLTPVIKNDDVQRWNLASNIVLKDFPKTWEDVQTIVRSGLAQQYFSVGDKFMVYVLSGLTTSIKNGSGVTGVMVDRSAFINKLGEIPRDEKQFTYDAKFWRDNNGNIVDIGDFGITIGGTPVDGDYIVITPSVTWRTFIVIGFDQETPADSNYTHSMTLQLETSLGSFSFDTKEATWYIDEETFSLGLLPMKYSFMVGSSSYCFTTTKHVPVGGQVVLNQSAMVVETYESAYDKQNIELVSVEVGSGGTELPAVNTNTDDKNVNSLNRVNYGSDNWAESDVRVWINSDGSAGSWWEPKSVFDRVPTRASSANGFLYCVDPSFISVIGEVKKTTQRGFTDGYGLANSTERFFLPSVAEVFGISQRPEDGMDGEAYTYYGAEYSDFSSPNDGADTNRIKGSTNWWLRSASTDTVGGYATRYVKTNGQIYRGSSYNGLAIHPVCAIV